MNHCKIDVNIFVIPCDSYMTTLTTCEPFHFSLKKNVRNRAKKSQGLAEFTHLVEMGERFQTDETLQRTRKTTVWTNTCKGVYGNSLPFDLEDR